MNAPLHPLNWSAGWLLILAAFVTGAGLGLFFHRENFLGGYASFRRRMLRLGHIALAALGMLNVIFSLGPCDSLWASRLLVAGGVTMPLVCFLAAWKQGCRHLFCVPVSALLVAVVLTIFGGDGSPSRPQTIKNTARSASAPYRDR